MRIILVVILCFSACLFGGCYAARSGAHAKAASRAGKNSVASAVTSTGKVDNVSRLLAELRGQKDVTPLVDEINAMGPSIFPGLIQLLRKGSKVERANVMYVMSRMKTCPPDAVSIIEELLDEKGADRVHVALDLQRICPGSDKARRVLEEELKRGDASVRIITARSISLSSNPEKSLSVLLEAMSDKEADVREAVLETLGEIGLKNKAAGALMVPNLIMALEDPSSYVSIQAARALGLIGAPAISAIPALQKMKSSSKKDKIKQAASRAIALISVEQRRKPDDGKSSKERLKSLL